MAIVKQVEKNPPPSYRHQEYPMWLYRKSVDDEGKDVVISQLVKDPEQMIALGPGWALSPDGPFDEPEQDEPPPPPPAPRRRRKAVSA